MRKKDKQVMAAALILAVFSVLFLGTRLSYLPQEDISWQIYSVHFRLDNGADLWREPRGVSFTWNPDRTRDDFERAPKVVLGGNVGSIIANGTKDLTAENGTKFRVYYYDVLMRLFVKVVGRKIPGSPWNWKPDLGVTVTVYVQLKARYGWRLLDAYCYAVNESIIVTHKDATPDASWGDGHQGTVEANEPSDRNQQIFIDGAGTNYAKTAKEFFSALTLIDGKKLRFKMYGRPLELHKYAWFVDYYAWGDARVEWQYVIRVAVAEPIPPDTSDLGDLEDNKPDINGYNEHPDLGWLEQIPWWGWVIIAVAAAWSISSIARAARGGEKIVIVGGG